MKQLLIFLSAFLLPLIVWGNDLSVHLSVINKNEISITVRNDSKKTISAYSYVTTYENQYDYFELEVKPDGGMGKPFVLNFLDDRDKSASVIVALKPGESFTHKIDIVAWALRAINIQNLRDAGFRQFPSKATIRIRYHNEPCGDCNDYYKSIWTGSIYSGWVVWGGS